MLGSRISAIGVGVVSIVVLTACGQSARNATVVTAEPTSDAVSKLAQYEPIHSMTFSAATFTAAGGLVIGQDTVRRVDPTTWSLTPIDALAGVRAVQALDGGNLVAVGTDAHGDLRLVETSDGGRTVAAKPIPMLGDPAPAAVSQPCFANLRTGAVLEPNVVSANSSTGILFTTDDGGATWRHAAAPAFGRLACLAGRLYLAGGAGEVRLYSTTDGGTSWQPIQITPPAGLATMRATFDVPTQLSSGELVETVTYADVTDARTAQGAVFTSTDGGANWQPVAAFPFPGVSVNVQVPADYRSGLWIVADPRGTVLHRSIDSGKHWSDIPVVGLPSANSISFDSTNRGLVLANGVLYATTDGSSFRNISPPAR